jgi:hypothetical protein
MKHFKQLFVLVLLAFLDFGQMWAVDVKDEFTSSTFSATSTTYVGTTIQGTSTTSGTAYSAFTNLAGTSDFGIRGYNKTKSGTETYSGIISTSTEGNLKSVKVTINTGSTTNRKVYVYGKTSAYTAVSDLFDNNKKGTLIQEITYTSGTTEYTITVPTNTSYQYVGITTNNNLLRFDKIEITWTTSSGSGSGSNKPTLSAEPSPENSGTIAIMHGETPFESGSEFEALETYTLTATPETGYKFVYWSLSDGTDAELVDDDEVANNEDEKNPVGILMAEETTIVTAHFAQPATVGDASNISCTGASFAVSNSANRNNYIVYTTSNTATPSGTWSSPRNGNGSITISSLTKNTTYYYWCASEVASGHYVYTDKKNFTTANNFDLNLTLSDGKGNTASAPSYTCIASGTSVTLTASPASGYVVSGWTVLDGNLDDITPTSTTATTFTFNMPTSNVTAEAIFQQQVVAPSFSPAAGTYGSAQNVTISTTTPNATIYYTIGTNPAAPTTGSTPYTSAISVSSNQTIKAIAVKDGMANSAVSTAAYTIKCATPEISLTAGTYTGAQTVTISGPTGATIYYTTNGSAPTTNSSVYSEALTVSSSQTIKAIAVKDGMANSEVASATYTIQYTVTWKVNGVAYTPKTTTGQGTDGTALVNSGASVTTLPTEPDPADYCGQRFMGWTNSDMGSTMGQGAPGVLFKTAASAPAVNGTTVYHAVFADYAE